MGSKTTVKTDIPEATAEEKQLQQANFELAQEQLSAIKRLGAFQEEQFEAQRPGFEAANREAEIRRGLETPEQQEARIRSEFERTQATGAAQDELLQLQLEQLRSDGSATPEQKALIEQATGAALEAGESDISRFLAKGIEQVRTELAPSRGLRPGDTPITNAGFDLAEEAQRQQGQLVSNLRGAQASAELNFPLAQQQVQGAQLTSQQQIQAASKQFQDQLSQQAFQNRLALTSGQPSLGLSGPNLQSNLATQRIAGAPTTTSKSGFGLGEVGAAASGIGSVLALCDKAMKEGFEDIDGAEILEQLSTMPVERWKYKGDSEWHIGTYAEEFNGRFSDEDTGTINLMDAVGVLMAAVKELNRKVEASNG